MGPPRPTPGTGWDVPAGDPPQEAAARAQLEHRPSAAARTTGTTMNGVTASAATENPAQGRWLRSILVPEHDDRRAIENEAAGLSREFTVEGAVDDLGEESSVLAFSRGHVSCPWCSEAKDGWRQRRKRREAIDDDHPRLVSANAPPRRRAPRGRLPGRWQSQALRRWGIYLLKETQGERCLPRSQAGRNTTPRRPACCATWQVPVPCVTVGCEGFRRGTASPPGPFSACESPEIRCTTGARSPE